MENKAIIPSIFDVQSEQQLTLEQIAQKVAYVYRSLQMLNQDTFSATELNEVEERLLLQIVEKTSHLSNPEKDEKFLLAIPHIHQSWQALKEINRNKWLQNVYAMVMLAVYQEEIPMNIETRILCLDDVDDFVRTLDKCGQKWSRRAKTLMRTNHSGLYSELFEKSRIYFMCFD